MIERKKEDEDSGFRDTDSGLLKKAGGMVIGGVGVGLWAVRIKADDGELRPWHYIHVYSIESRFIMKLMETQMGGTPVNPDRLERCGRKP